MLNKYFLDYVSSSPSSLTHNKFNIWIEIYKINDMWKEIVWVDNNFNHLNRSIEIMPVIETGAQLKKYTK